MTTVPCKLYQWTWGRGPKDQSLGYRQLLCSCISVSSGSADCRASGETSCMVQPIPSLGLVLRL